jgi:hypothetical protein
MGEFRCSCGRAFSTKRERDDHAQTHREPMSDPQRPEREAIEQAIKGLPCYDSDELQDAPGYFLKKSDVLEMLAAMTPTPTPGWQRGKWQVEVYQPTDGSKTTWVHLKDGDVIVQQWMVAHPGVDFDNMTDWHKTLAILALPPTPTPGWRDISTAPKDGTFILIYPSSCWVEDVEHDYEVSYWDEDFGRWHFSALPDDYTGPTHWQPLPPAPTGDRS